MNTQQPFRIVDVIKYNFQSFLGYTLQCVSKKFLFFAVLNSTNFHGFAFHVYYTEHRTRIRSHFILCYSKRKLNLLFKTQNNFYYSEHKLTPNHF